MQPRLVAEREEQAVSRADAPRRLVILGATGSIGRSTADVIEGAPGGFVVEAVAGGRDGAALARMAIRLGARFAAVSDPSAYADLKAGLAGHAIEAAAGDEAVELAALRESDLVVAAISGAAGVGPTHAALAAGRKVALANKECLVCAGDLFMRTAAQAGTQILPMDSEHNAIFQALGANTADEVEEMILTASGGPFRTWSAERIAAATPDQALAHPNWSMGPKVTIDSATLMNKGLELIEAHHIFGIPAKKLGVLVHPQSIVHGLVSFADGAVVAGLACPDMKVPIAHCLGYPARVPTAARRLDLAAIATLSFEKPDFERFPALGVAMAALEQGGALPTVLNAANEIAVEAFLAGRIGFMDIARIVEACCKAAARDSLGRTPQSVVEALDVDRSSRERARGLVG
ncbi:MAG: dxr [Hyphomicrobiales bacterium]|nr:dxr [Hyphomicrobiales bacterium]